MGASMLVPSLVDVNLRHMRGNCKRWVEVFAGGLKVAGIYCKPNGERVVYHPLAPVPKQTSANRFGGSKAHEALAHRLLEVAETMPVGPRQAISDTSLVELARHIHRLLTSKNRRIVA